MTTKEFLIKYQHEPWVRGKHDCILFIYKFLSEVYEEPPAADPKDFKYHNYKSARKKLVKLCREHGVISFEGFLDKYYYRDNLPSDGGIIAKRDTEGLTGYSYGVVYDGACYFVGETGLKGHEINPTYDLFWSIN